MARNYRQFCALARALDVVGGRWTLLIVRELLLGPRRYGEILDALPGIGTNLLADRLEAMAGEGLCERRGRLYSLTERGHHLREPVLALARWGMSPMASPRAGELMRPDWYMIAMLAAYQPTPGPHREAFEFDIDGVVVHLEVQDGNATAGRGSAERPAFRLTVDLPGFLSIATRSRSPAAGEITGSRRSVERWLRMFALPVPQ